MLTLMIIMAAMLMNSDKLCGDKIPMEYHVKKATGVFDPNNGWESRFWANAGELQLCNFMGQKPEHFPPTRAKVLYDANNIYVMFSVSDRYVRAVAKKFQDSVCRDSCVEFFFTPGEDISKGYFNLETNCGGVILLYHQTSRSENRRSVADEDCEQIKIAASLPRTVEPEITEPTSWTIQYAIPYTMLQKYAPVMIPQKGVRWRANFYKCADATSHPHWLTWAKVARPKPDFHLPEFFGTIVFE